MTVLFCFHFNEKNNGGVKSLLDMLEVFSEKRSSNYCGISI